MANFAMDWGVHLPHLGRGVGRATLTQFAQTLEQWGVHSAWVSDHVCWPAEIESKYPYAEDGSFALAPDVAWLDPIGTLTFIAGVTEKIRLGTSVLILPYRQPVTTAKQLATLDVLSEGRLILGAGVGWMEEEAKILGMPWDRRGRRTDEQLALFHSLFTAEEPAFQGEFYQIPRVGFEPKPVQSPLPIWIGGASDAAFKRAAHYGTGFHAAFQPLATVVEEFAAVKRYAEAAGRDPEALTLSLRVFLDSAGVMDPEKSIGGSVAEMQARIAELETAGVNHILLDPVARGGIEGRLNAVNDFIQNVA